MTYPLSRFMSTASASYGVYALAQPRHLGSALTSKEKDAASYDVLARTYGARDVVVSTFGIFGKSEKTVTAAMLIRIAFDVADGLVLSREAETDEVRQMVRGVTFGWATLNALALLVDRSRA
jgi:hypothetical protein